MNNKEALKFLSELASYGCYQCSKYDECHQLKEHETICENAKFIILKSLDRLEKLEQFVDIYKNTNQRFTMLIQSKSSILPNPTLEQELLRKEVLENE